MRFKRFIILFVTLIFLIILSGCNDFSRSSFLFWCERDEISSVQISIINYDMLNHEKIKNEFNLVDGFLSSQFDKKLQKITIFYNNTLSKSTNYKYILIKNNIIFK